MPCPSRGATIALILLSGLALADQKPKPQDCTVLKNYQDHVRSEVRGMKEGEISEPCPVPKKAPVKKKPHAPAGQGGKNG